MSNTPGLREWLDAPELSIGRMRTVLSIIAEPPPELVEAMAQAIAKEADYDMNSPVAMEWGRRYARASLAALASALPGMVEGKS